MNVHMRTHRYDSQLISGAERQYTIAQDSFGQRGFQCAIAGSAHLHQDIATCDANSGEEFTVTVGKRTFSGKGAREEAAKALTHAALARPTDLAIRSLAGFRGFEILSKAKMTAAVPDLYFRGSSTYSANLNPDNPVGTVQSMHALRALDRLATEEHREIEQLQKKLTDYQTQADRAFEHETRLKELLGRQMELNAALDLDKGETQAAEPADNTAEPPTQNLDGQSTTAEARRAPTPAMNR